MPFDAGLLKRFDTTINTGQKVNLELFNRQISYNGDYNK